MSAINEYQLVKSGVTSYERLGYEVPDGGAAYVKLIEYLVIDAAITDAQNERDK